MKDGFESDIISSIDLLMQKNENLSKKVDELQEEKFWLSNTLGRVNKCNDNQNTLARISVELSCNSKESSQKDSHIYTSYDVPDHSLSDSNII